MSFAIHPGAQHVRHQGPRPDVHNQGNPFHTPLAPHGHGRPMTPGQFAPVQQVFTDTVYRPAQRYNAPTIAVHVDRPYGGSRYFRFIGGSGNVHYHSGSAALFLIKCMLITSAALLLLGLML